MANFVYPYMIDLISMQQQNFFDEWFLNVPFNNLTFQLYVAATDNGLQRRTGFVRVQVTVVRNRNGPVFQSAQYNVTIAETLSQGASVVRVAATDADGVSLIFYFLEDY